MLFKEKANYKIPGCRPDKLRQDQTAGWFFPDFPEFAATPTFSRCRVAWHKRIGEFWSGGADLVGAGTLTCIKTFGGTIRAHSSGPERRDVPEAWGAGEKA